jgi:hypothetical protein
MTVTSKAQTVIINSEVNAENNVTIPAVTVKLRRIDLASHGFDWTEEVPTNALKTIHPSQRPERLILAAEAAIQSEMAATAMDATIATMGVLRDRCF